MVENVKESKWYQTYLFRNPLVKDDPYGRLDFSAYWLGVLSALRLTYELADEINTQDFLQKQFDEANKAKEALIKELFKVYP